MNGNLPNHIDDIFYVLNEVGSNAEYSRRNMIPPEHTLEVLRHAYGVLQWRVGAEELSSDILNYVVGAINFKCRELDVSDTRMFEHIINFIETEQGDRGDLLLRLNMGSEEFQQLPNEEKWKGVLPRSNSNSLFSNELKDTQYYNTLFKQKYFDSITILRQMTYMKLLKNKSIVKDRIKPLCDSIEKVLKSCVSACDVSTKQEYDTYVNCVCKGIGNVIEMMLDEEKNVFKLLREYISNPEMTRYAFMRELGVR